MLTVSREVSFPTVSNEEALPTISSGDTVLTSGTTLEFLYSTVLMLSRSEHRARMLSSVVMMISSPLR